MDIIYCFDDKYKEMAEKSAKTVLKYNPNANIHFMYSKDNTEYPELNEFTEELCGFKHVSKACFLRLLIPKYFPQLEKALYLDCDTICTGSLEELFNTSFDNKYILACRGHNYSDVQAKQLGFEWYIVSGMLLFDIKRLNENNYFKHIKDTWRGAIGKQEPFSADETIINWCFHDKIKLVSEKWNYCVNRNYGDRECKNPVILHFPSRNKGEFYRCYKKVIH